jgi:hypothetical protein
MTKLYLGNYGGNPSRLPLEIPKEDAEFIERSLEKLLKINSKHAWASDQLVFICNALAVVETEKELSALLTMLEKVKNSLLCINS